MDINKPLYKIMSFTPNGDTQINYVRTDDLDYLYECANIFCQENAFKHLPHFDDVLAEDDYFEACDCYIITVDEEGE